MLGDLRTAARSLARTPAFTVTAVVTLALGIGANALVFSLAYGVLLRPLPFEAPDRLVAVTATRKVDGIELPGGVSVLAMDAWRDSSKALTGPALYRTEDRTITGQGGPERAEVCLVSEGFFATFGTRPAAGRLLDARDGDTAVAVITHETRQRRFGASNPLGRQLRVDGRPYTVVGVMPRAFVFPRRAVALWIPRLSVPGEAKSPGVRKYQMVARLTPRAGLESARAEASVISARLQAADARFSRNVTASIERLEDVLVGDARRGLLVLLVAVGAVLLVACVNVGSLGLARGAARHGELAMRSALGASRGHLVRALAGESVLTAAAGAVLAWGLAAVLLPAAVAFTAPDSPRRGDIAMDLPVLGFTLAVSALTVLLTGLLPAWRVSRLPVREVLSGHAGPVRAGRTRRLRGALAGIQAAVSVVVLVGAVLFVRSLGVLLGVEGDRGGSAVVTMGLTLPPPVYAGCDGGGDCARVTAFGQEALARLGAIPGVESAALATSLPPKTAEMSFTLPLRSRETGKVEPRKYQLVVVAGDFFRALRIPILRGRLFDARDGSGREAVFVASRDFVRQQFGSEDAVGRQMPFGPPDAKGMPTPATLVGVVDDVRYAGLDQPPGGAIYFPFAQKPYPSFNLVARSAGRTRAIAAAMPEIVRSLDPEVPTSASRTLAELRRASVAEPASRAAILGSLAALALVLVGVGLYAAASDTTIQRTAEIGLRMALGADRRATVRMVLVSGLAPVAIGLAAGLAAAVAFSRVTTSLLFGVRPTDPVTYAAAAVLIAGVAAAAIAGPARRAVRVDPASALRRAGG